jgi:hypothetical protein
MLGFLAQTTTDFTYTTTEIDTGEAAALFGIGLGIMFLFGLLFYLILAFISSFVFKKAGRPMWVAYVPIYNSWVLFEIAGKPGWWVLLNFIPFVGSIIYFVLWIVAALELAKRFGRSALFAVLGLIVFPLIGFIILAFGKSQYSAEEGGQSGFVPPVTPIDPTPQNEPITPVQPNFGQTPAPSQQMPSRPIASVTPETPAPTITPQPSAQPQDDTMGNPQNTPPTPPANPAV